MHNSKESPIFPSAQMHNSKESENQHPDNIPESMTDCTVINVDVTTSPIYYAEGEAKDTAEDVAEDNAKDDRGASPHVDGGDPLSIVEDQVQPFWQIAIGQHAFILPRGAAQELL
ncbi:hypothetical protein BC936DRAFT_142456 [Jimgerdemannia flammicorona]|uniref:Uncharacterized protein n=1 Tax=Jimgerdemannia flammicorona TaxID=994334 RepID=A0A433A0D8_9FUNG|nr:hypothetical protein BC936DRAFT_142456 [Jimgerdemannia flammicorona]